MSAAITDPADVFYGGLLTKVRADRQRAEADRLDRRMLRAHTWSTDGDDDTLGGARAEHLPSDQRSKP